MKPRLLALLACPACRQPFEIEAFEREGDEVLSGLLHSSCGKSYPIVDGIPRILRDAFVLFPDFVTRYGARIRPDRLAGVDHAFDEAITRTRASFGYQWTTFDKMVTDFRDNFLSYIHPLDATFFPGKVGVDVGCGFGRHIYHAAQFGAEMVGVDISAAIDATHRNTRGLRNVHLVQANIYELPFCEHSFDFAYSIGVLHHLSDPEAGFRSVVSLVKPKGAVFIWVYSKARPVVNAVLESFRVFSTRLPFGVQKGITWMAAAVDWSLFIVPYRGASKLALIGPVVSRRLPRLDVYGHYPFQVIWADWFDRLSAPIRFYYDGNDLQGWLSRAGLTRRRVSQTGLFGWRAYGEQP
jgi:SAM-dependent methyltransferase